MNESGMKIINHQSSWMNTVIGHRTRRKSSLVARHDFDVRESRHVARDTWRLTIDFDDLRPTTYPIYCTCSFLIEAKVLDISWKNVLPPSTSQSKGFPTSNFRAKKPLAYSLQTSKYTLYAKRIVWNVKLQTENRSCRTSRIAATKKPNPLYALFTQAILLFIKSKRILVTNIKHGVKYRLHAHEIILWPANAE